MIKQFVDSQYCLNKCRLCCKFSQQESVWSPALLDEEIAESQKNNIPPAVINKHKKLVLEPFPKHKDSSLPGHMDMIFVCPFLDTGSNKCKIYSFRPLECKIYPFLINKRDDKVFLSVDPGCPFIKERLSTLEFKEYVQNLTAFILDPAQTAVLKRNPQLFQVYDDALDLVEIKL